jgi:hypothetical protein
MARQAANGPITGLASQVPLSALRIKKGRQAQRQHLAGAVGGADGNVPFAVPRRRTCAPFGP